MPAFSKSANGLQQFVLLISVSKPDENEGKAAVPAAAAKQGSKKSASAKKAELNSKGTLGSDMDAFTDLNPKQKQPAPTSDETDNVTVKVNELIQAEKNDMRM